LSKWRIDTGKAAGQGQCAALINAVRDASPLLHGLEEVRAARHSLSRFLSMSNAHEPKKKAALPLLRQPQSNLSREMDVDSATVHVTKSQCRLFLEKEPSVKLASSRSRTSTGIILFRLGAGLRPQSAGPISIRFGRLLKAGNSVGVPC
jgi:hypothetical protein